MKVNSSPDIAQQQVLLDAMLPHVAFDGWSQTALDHAAKDRGISLNQNMKNVDDYIDIHINIITKSMQENLAGHSMEKLRLSEKIEMAILARLEAMLPHREAVRKLLAHDAMPQNAAAGLVRMYRVVDAIWKAAGDHPTDFSFYTKRLTLAGIYGSCLLCWLADESENQTETRAFLKRRLGELGQFHKGKAKLKNQLDRLIGAWRSPAA